MNKLKALASFLEISQDDITELFENNFEADDADWLVLTDDEANSLTYDYINGQKYEESYDGNTLYIYRTN
jgi:hypothetical protein